LNRQGCKETRNLSCLGGNKSRVVQMGKSRDIMDERRGVLLLAPAGEKDSRGKD
jgi:hypothetical protein